MGSSTIFLFLHSPLIPSLEEALVPIKATGLFSIHIVRIDKDLLPLVIDARPCVCVFSITDDDSYKEICELLDEFRKLRVKKGLRSRDPSLRIVLASEKRMPPIERWNELNIHEFIIAPVLPKSVAFKLMRHYYKSFSQERPKHQDEEPFPLPALVNDEREPTYGKVLIAGNDEDSPEFLNRVKISAGDLGVDPNKGRWVSRAMDSEFGKKWGGLPKRTGPKDSVGNDIEDAWEWIEGVPGEAGSEDDAPPPDQRTQLLFRGDQPRYDPVKKAWTFRSEAPLLIRKRGHGSTEVLVSSAVAYRGGGSSGLPEQEVKLAPDFKSEKVVAETLGANPTPEDDPNDLKGSRQGDRASSGRIPSRSEQLLRLIETGEREEHQEDEATSRPGRKLDDEVESESAPEFSLPAFFSTEKKSRASKSGRHQPENNDPINAIGALGGEVSTPLTDETGGVEFDSSRLARPPWEAEKAPAKASDEPARSESAAHQKGLLDPQRQNLMTPQSSPADKGRLNEGASKPRTPESPQNEEGPSIQIQTQIIDSNLSKGTTAGGKSGRQEVGGSPAYVSNSNASTTSTAEIEISKSPSQPSAHDAPPDFPSAAGNAAQGALTTSGPGKSSTTWSVQNPDEALIRPDASGIAGDKTYAPQSEPSEVDPLQLFKSIGAAEGVAVPLEEEVSKKKKPTKKKSLSKLMKRIFKK